MADINIIGVSERDTHPTRAAAILPYRVERQIDLKEVEAKKGSGLATGDVVIALRIPPKSVIRGAYVAVDTKLSNAAVTADVDTESGESLLAAVAIGAADAGDIVAAAAPAPVVTNTELDFVNVTLTGVAAGNTGQFRVMLEVIDLEAIRNPGIAQLGS